ncbi:MAG: hypothetical protein NTV51_16845 [Verrucomicrobia bacterium]|nr:hypothetical protein [Verrucomicrobiota bacterium]
MSPLMPKGLLLWMTLTAPSLLAHTLEFAGFSSVGKSVSVVLSDGETREVSSWMKIGQEWKGFVVTHIDAQGRSIIVTKAGESLVVPLKSAHVKEGKMAPSQGLIGFNLLRGACTWVDGKWVYSPDAMVQFGGGILSATSGVMIAEGEAILGNLSLDYTDGRMMEAENGKAVLMEGTPVLLGGKMRITLPKR